MNAEEFLEAVVRPCLEDAKDNPLVFHRLLSLVFVTDAFAARVFHSRKTGCLEMLGASGTALKDDTAFREWLANSDESFRLLRDLAKAQKHAELDRGTPVVSSSRQIEKAELGYGEGAFGEGPYGGGEQIIVRANDGTARNVLALCEDAIDLLTRKLVSREWRS